MTYHGLTSVAAKERFIQYGANEIRSLLTVSVWKVLFRQIVSNFIIYLLFLATLISVFVGKYITAYTIGSVIILVIGLGFFQEYRAEKAIKSLKTMLVTVSIVIRNGSKTEVPARELVPGDIVVLRSGEKAPADCVILESNALKVDESILTGESSEIDKNAVVKGDLPSDANKIYMGSLIVSGKGVVEVTHTGKKTQIGKISGHI
jgi:Ca2+-transporting ATPase